MAQPRRIWPVHMRETLSILRQGHTIKNHRHQEYDGSAFSVATHAHRRALGPATHVLQIRQAANAEHRRHSCPIRAHIHERTQSIISFLVARVGSLPGRANSEPAFNQVNCSTRELRRPCVFTFDFHKPRSDACQSGIKLGGQAERGACTACSPGTCDRSSSELLLL